MAKGKRQANFELLRILAMYMVVVMHYLTRTGTLPEAGDKLSGPGFTSITLEAVCIVAVNVYVLLSGYFLSAAVFSWTRLFKLLAQVLFYTVLIPPVLMLAGILPAGGDIYHLLNSFFPVQSGQYWFVTAYIVLVLFSPVLNAALERLQKKLLSQTLFGLLLFFCIGKSIIPLQLATDRFGYDYGWFLVLYLTGGYIRKYGIGFFKNARRSFGVYAGSVLLTIALETALLFISRRTEALNYYFTVPFHYNYFLCFTGAMGLFYLFFHINIPEGKCSRVIRFLSPAVFGVYLIHEQADISTRWYACINALTGLAGIRQQTEGLGYWLSVMLLQTAIVFFLCILMDKLRGVLFGMAERAFASAAQAGGKK